MNDGRQRQWVAAAAVAESRKRKERDVAAEFRRVHLTTRHEPPPPAQKSPAAAGGGGNRLLAGYLAHEFLTLGTLFGQRWDPPAAVKPPAPPLRAVGKSGAPRPRRGVPFEGGGAHIPGIVNPTQLARWLQM
ncbi:unnamed protein product [Spirodela intermedia]|uniref:Uncharacterized protein n=1 Tax=Spirodela intermedia TaxID=51605 RepID=A0A7I8IE00_SPIIN|nr:unnamed protein product [Spirodela intermedia]CAA6655313.1 unnamed protein product [Spirodela intermedia]